MEEVDSTMSSRFLITSTERKISTEMESGSCSLPYQREVSLCGSCPGRAILRALGQGLGFQTEIVYLSNSSKSFPYSGPAFHFFLLFPYRDRSTCQSESRFQQHDSNLGSLANPGTRIHQPRPGKAVAFVSNGNLQRAHGRMHRTEWNLDSSGNNIGLVPWTLWWTQPVSAA